MSEYVYKRVLTMQDISCMGQCSITVALPIISACGMETVILPSAILSNHTGGFKAITARDLTEDMKKIIDCFVIDGTKFDCFYSGYIGNAKQIDYVEEIVDKLLKKDSIKIIDPAMADHGRLYKGFDMAFVKEMKRMCSYADILLPNLTEAALLSGIEYKYQNIDETYIKNLLIGLKNLGAKKIVLKGVSYDVEKTGVAVFDCATEELSYYFTRKCEKNSHGTGDCFASSFTGAILRGFDILEAAKIAADFVVECLENTIYDEEHWYGVKFEKAIPSLIKRLN